MTLGPTGDELYVEKVTHDYGGVAALRDVTLSVKQREFITLLGPSGCGKTTLLRIIGGFIRPTRGRILLNGRDLTNLAPHKRPTNTVFQRSTLFPHLSVFENVAFGLRLLKLSEDEVRRRVTETLALVRLSGFEDRRSHELSGGQAQRIALARVLIVRPRVLLLDEPLSALDLAIRLEMEEELRRLHREVGSIFVYVTHDQREALALSNRIVVLNKGQIEQLGTPDEIYRTPASPFTARFVGDANLVPVEITRVANDYAVMLLAKRSFEVPLRSATEPGAAWLVVRPEVIRVNAEENSHKDGLRGIVRDFAYRGSGHAYRIAVEGLEEPLKAEVAAERAAAFPVGRRVTVSWDPHSPLILPRSR
jgi:ABC-type Fe3+/spermidine/putrescine transport system ATPase subunit